VVARALGRNKNEVEAEWRVIQEHHLSKSWE
jgi:hypothetical protein